MLCLSEKSDIYKFEGPTLYNTPLWASALFDVTGQSCSQATSQPETLVHRPPSEAEALQDCYQNLSPVLIGRNRSTSELRRSSCEVHVFVPFELATHFLTYIQCCNQQKLGMHSL